MLFVVMLCFKVTKGAVTEHEQDRGHIKERCACLSAKNHDTSRTQLKC